MKIWKIAVVIFFAQLAIAASAAPITFGARTDFEGQGEIAEFQDFESFDSDEFTFPGEPFVDGSISYTSEGENLIVGSNTFINPISNTLSNDTFDTAVTGDIGGEFNMFALDMAVNNPNAIGDVTLTLFTNLSSYFFDLTLPAVQNEQLFQGFTLSGSEYFTGFAFDAFNFVHIDNVTLGNLDVPAPATLALMLSGLLGLGFARLRRRTNV